MRLSLLIPVVFVSAALATPGSSPEPAAQMLNEGHADQALAMLAPALNANGGDAAALNLLTAIYKAVALLRSYLASSNQAEEAPAFEVHAELAQLPADGGDNAGAQSELAAAHALASGWQPRAGEHKGE